MSWSVKVAGRPADVLAKFTEHATASWGYTHSVLDKEAIDWAIAALKNRVDWYSSNQVPTTILELEGSGHFDDTAGGGNVTVGCRVITDRRRA